MKPKSKPKAKPKHRDKSTANPRTKQALLQEIEELKSRLEEQEDSPRIAIEFRRHQFTDSAAGQPRN